MTSFSWARALRCALDDSRTLTPEEAARVGYEPHGIVVTSDTGETTIQLQQTFTGISIRNAIRSVRFRDDETPVVTGSPVRVSSDDLPDATVPATEAAYAACRHVADELRVRVSNRRPRELAAFVQPDRPTVLRKVGFRDPITARLRLHRDGEERLSLVWEVEVEPDGDLMRPRVVLVTATGREPQVVDARTRGAHAVSAIVDDVSPPTAGTQNPPPPVPLPRSRDDYPAVGALVLPPGAWVDAGRTRGNNVVVVGDNEKTFAATPTSGGDLVFQAADGTGVEQAMVNAFYLCNYLHDFFHLLGFDERSLNFQTRNATGLGKGNDAVKVFVFSRPRDAFAFFLNRLDGREPNLVLRPGPGGRHAGLDPDVVIHEYVHGVTARMVGRGGTADPFLHPQSVALSEGLSDYFALTLQNYLRRKRGIGEVLVFGGWIRGTATGLRASAYGPGFTATYGSLRAPGFAAHHDAGQVWCQTLLEMNEALGAGNRNLGDERGWQVVVDALRNLHNGSDGPHFLHARDAVYAALRARVGFWGVAPSAVTGPVEAVFAARGMGPGARSGSADYDRIQEAF